MRNIITTRMFLPEYLEPWKPPRNSDLSWRMVYFLPIGSF